MKIIWNIIGGALLLLGLLFFSQGVGMLAGSSMTGRPQWAVIGGLAVLVGAGLLLYVNRRETPR